MNTNLNITPSMLRSCGACWSDDRIREAFGGLDGMTPRQVAERADITLQDRMWAVCNFLYSQNSSVAHLCAVETALKVMHLAGDSSAQGAYANLLLGSLEGGESDWEKTWNHATVRACRIVNSARRLTLRTVRATWYAGWDAIMNEELWECISHSSRALGHADFLDIKHTARENPYHANLMRVVEWCEIMNDPAEITTRRDHILATLRQSAVH